MTGGIREDLLEERRKKLERLVQAGHDPYPARLKRTMTIGQALKKFSSLARAKKNLSLTGRLLALRDQGKVVFADLVDETGEIQLVLKQERTKQFALWKEVLDRGDFASASGCLFKTKRGERSLEVKQFAIIAKALRPIPATFYGLKDTETLLRKRYLDFIIHPDLKEIFAKKARFWRTTREYLERAGFLEVETPILEAVPGGAEAEPFSTHHRALDEDFYLRISPELSLKRLLVGGFEKVFEIGRIFRNEGIDAEHLQDYTQMEMYWAFQDYEGLMKFLERMVKEVIKKTCGALTTRHQGVNLEWGRKWPRLDYVKLFREATGLDLEQATKVELVKRAAEVGLKQIHLKMGRGRLIDLIYKKTVRPNLIQPAFLINPPVDVEPLAKRLAGANWRVERFQIVAGGTELGKGFSELNDPLDQRQRFEEQMALRALGDKAAQMLDKDYLEAMEYGLPPAAGFAYSERLFAVLMDRSVRETIFFPLVRTKKTNHD